MAKDRSIDRHQTRGTLMRIDPPDLLERLDAAVGKGNRSWVVSRLLAAFLDGKSLPDVHGLREERSKWGRTTRRSQDQRSRSTVDEDKPDTAG